MGKKAKGPLCTRETIAQELTELGVERGETLLVHSSMSSLGWVSGGAEAVVLGLLDALGDEGTLVVPTFSGHNSDPALWQFVDLPEEWIQPIRDTLPAYNRHTTRTRKVGTIPETARTWPEAVRSDHPQLSFAAIGPQAQWLMSDHKLDCCLGNDSPLRKLEEANARVLLLGVDFTACTSFHLAEYRVSNPPLEENSFAASIAGERRWKTVQDVALSAQDFDKIGADFESNTPVQTGYVGAAKSRLFSLPKAVAHAQAWLSINRRTC
ncbi:hypothetical protein TRICI_002426 [Trichomonascus ciferrii]|uniref:Aminoglycoside N(3)-acetyltransferase n=1 Tax=Trichomonascus ciferrii TaxID=44093 RepID=A0A642V6N4_9ASCO|nr:hypothetical protein TRICI_002426 [Trichomonascus ciferrii]